jgi:DHA1 family multidrug resistance protein-like MFS transporter
LQLGQLVHPCTGWYLRKWSPCRLTGAFADNSHSIGLGLTIFGTYFVAQSVLLYIPNIYPRYAASIFSANSLSRSLFAFAAVLFARPMFQGIGVDGGVSLLGGFMILCTLGMLVLFRFGKSMRERSRFAVA